VTILGNYPVDRTDFRIIRGVQNEILFFVRNLDRNPSNTTYFQSLTINITDPASATLLMSRHLTVVDAASALYQLTILPSETADWLTGTLQWSISVTRVDGVTTMLWTDRNYGPYSSLEVSPGPVPGPAAPIELDPSTFLIRQFVQYSPILPGAAQRGYQGGAQTFAVYPVGFTGTIEIDASLAAQPSTDSDWFVASTTNYVAQNSLTTINQTSGSAISVPNCDWINVTGNYLWLRVLITTTQTPTSIYMAGSAGANCITQIVYKN
jgi:hypothetical protein